MPQYAPEQLNARQQTPVTTPELSFKPQAQPVDTTRFTYVNPHQFDGLRQLAQGLANFGQGFQDLGYAMYQTQKKKDMEEGIAGAQAQAQQDAISGMTIQAAEAKGAEMAPEFRQVYAHTYGNFAAENDRQLAQTIYQNPEVAAQHGIEPFDSNNTSPEYAQQWHSKFINKRLEGITDPYIRNAYLKAYSPEVRQATQDSYSRAIQFTHDLQDASLSQSVDVNLSKLVTNAPDKNPYFVGDLIKHYTKMGFQRPEVEKQLVQQVYARAIDPQNPMPELLRVLDQPGEDMGNGNKYPGWGQRAENQLTRTQMYDHALRVYHQWSKQSVQKATAEQLFAMDMKIKKTKDDPWLTQESAHQLANDLTPAARMLGKSEDWIANTRVELVERAVAAENLRNHLWESIGNNISPTLAFPEKKDQDTAWNLALEREKQYFNGDVDAAAVSLGHKTNSMFPGHIDQFVSAYNEVVAKKGELDSNATLLKKFPLLLEYGTFDGNNREMALKEIGAKDPAASAFYRKLFTQMEHQGSGDVIGAARAAWMMVSNPKQVNPGDESVKALLEKTLKGFDNAGATNPDYVKQWVLEEMTLNNAKTPGDYGSAAILEDSFKRTHQTIGGKWVYTGNAPQFSKEQMVQLPQAIMSYAILKADQHGMWDAFNIDLSKVNVANPEDDMRYVTLAPHPSSFTKEGYPEYSVFINGVPLPERINLQYMLRQFNNPQMLSDPHYAQLRHDKITLANVNRTGSTMSPEYGNEYLSRLSLYKQAGMVTDEYFDSASKIVTKAMANDGKAAYLHEERVHAAFQNGVTLFKNMNDDSDPAVTSKAILDKQTPSVYGDLKAAIQSDLNEIRPAQALAKAVFGAQATALADPKEEGPQHIGVGFNLAGKDPKVIDDTLSRTRIKSQLGSLQARVDPMSAGSIGKFVVNGLRKGELKLNPRLTDNLLEDQLGISEKRVKEVIGEETFQRANPNQQAALKVLAMAVGDRQQDLDEAISKVVDGDWKGLRDDLKNVPENRRDSALGFIRAMAQARNLFKSIIDNQ